MSQTSSRKKLAPLVRGDIIDIVAPASATALETFQEGIRALENFGFQPRYPKNLFHPSPLFANTDDRRFEFLKKALLAKDSKAVWCVRGGYGSLRLLPELNRVKKPSTPKIFIGFSDITTLHVFLNQKWGWPTFHGPVLDRFGKHAAPAAEMNELWRILQGKKAEQVFRLKPLNAIARSPKTVHGPMAGGNVAVLQSSIGTPWQVDFSGRIVFFEDIGERPHRMDRMLTQMIQAGLFRKARAIVFGNMELTDAEDRRCLWKDVIQSFAKGQKIPVLKGMSAGHGSQQRMVPFGTGARLELAASSARLSIVSGIENAEGVRREK